MTNATLFWLIVNLGLYLTGMLLLDAAHRAHISELKRGHDAELSGMRTYIRTLNRERKWLEAELAKVKDKVRERERVSAEVDHIQWMPMSYGQELPPSEEYGEGD